jgi:hypothetical protein
VPQKWIVSVQLYRAVGLIFLVLYAGGHLPGIFAWHAGVGGVLVGLLPRLLGSPMREGRAMQLTGCVPGICLESPI